jgi:predicted DNA-binding transcriptional regulator YafY
MPTKALSSGGTPTWSVKQLARLPRLIRLITEIKANPRQTPEQLRQALGISRARFFEDKKLLEEALGFTFRFIRAKRSYEILNDPYLPLVDLKLSEAFALVLAVRQLSAAGDYILTYEAVEGIRKIVASAQPALRSFLQNVLDEMVLREGFGCNAAILEDLRRACGEHHHVVIAYHHYDQDAMWRHEIDPYQLFFKRRALYLDAYDKAAKDFRVFRVNRIREVKFTGVRGVMVGDYSFAARFQDTFSTFVGERATAVKVRFTRRIAPYIQESLWHGSQQITPLPDGCILYEVRVGYPKEVAWWALSWGSEAEVLEPPELRAYVVTTNLFPQEGIVPWIGSSYAEALCLPRSGEPRHAALTRPAAWAARPRTAPAGGRLRS